MQQDWLAQNSSALKPSPVHRESLSMLFSADELEYVIHECLMVRTLHCIRIGLYTSREDFQPVKQGVVLCLHSANGSRCLGLRIWPCDRLASLY
jgi:hypothetical protein